MHSYMAPVCVSIYVLLLLHFTKDFEERFRLCVIADVYIYTHSLILFIKYTTYSLTRMSCCRLIYLLISIRWRHTLLCVSPHTHSGFDSSPYFESGLYMCMCGLYGCNSDEPAASARMCI